jgi:hypothetical protein
MIGFGIGLFIGMGFSFFNMRVREKMFDELNARNEKRLKEFEAMWERKIKRL